MTCGERRRRRLQLGPEVHPGGPQRRRGGAADGALGRCAEPALRLLLFSARRGPRTAAACSTLALQPPPPRRLLLRLLHAGRSVPPCSSPAPVARAVRGARAVALPLARAATSRGRRPHPATRLSHMQHTDLTSEGRVPFCCKFYLWPLVICRWVNVRVQSCR